MSDNKADFSLGRSTTGARCSTDDGLEGTCDQPEKLTAIEEQKTRLATKFLFLFNMTYLQKGGDLIQKDAAHHARQAVGWATKNQLQLSIMRQNREIYNFFISPDHVCLN